MNKAQPVKPNHPSFGHQQAWFLFALTAADGGMVRLLSVQARNPWAIQTIETMAAGDGKVSSNCELLSVFYEKGSVRSCRVQEVKYVDFMLDIVDPGYLMQNTVVTTSFEQSLSKEEKRYANMKLDAMMKLERAKPRLIPMGPPPPKYPLPPEMEDVPQLMAPVVIDTTAEVFDPETSVVYQQAMSALTDLGFKKPQVKKVLNDMGHRVDNETIENVIKRALRQLQVA